MTKIKRCPYCFRNIPDESIYCPYCGRQVERSEQHASNQDELAPVSKLIGKVTEIIERTKPTIQKHLLNAINSIEKNIQSGSFPRFIDQQKVQQILNNLRTNISSEQDQATLKEYKSYADFVSKAISGDKCIVCLQEFKIEENERIEVALCPNCSFAAHRDHFFTWLNERSMCPMCRTEINKQNLIIGYLIKDNEQLIFSGK